MAVQPSNIKTFKIDGQDLGGRADQTILEVAREHHVSVPTLCHLEGLSTVGACRMCMIEIKGNPRLMAACVTQVQEGIEVFTNSERIQKYRRMILELLFAERNHVCSVCVTNGNCELQTLAHSHGMTHVSLPYQHPKLPLDASHDRFIIDHNRCVLCTRCVRVCDEIEGAHTWDIMGRGTTARVITDLNTPWGESDTCTSCGKCVHVCPTGALTEKGQKIGDHKHDRQFLPYLKTMRRMNG